MANMNEKKIIYLDNAATTRMSERVFREIIPYLKDDFGNPSSVCSVGRNARQAVDKAREEIALCLGADINEIYFTASGTESNNWAIKSAMQFSDKKGKHIITSAIEHPAVLNTVKYLQQCGFEATYLGVDKFGNISIDELKSAIRSDTVMVSIMMANNEIGTILPIDDIAKVTSENSILLHTDAVQVVGQMPINLRDARVDMLTFSAHKLGGMKGVGALYIKKGVKLQPLIHGGGQEKSKRSGTENVAGIVSLASALKEKSSALPQDKIIKMRDKMIEGILRIPKSHLTGDPVRRLPGIASFVFEGVEGEAMLLMLDRYGICASSGSACSSGSLDPSHVLLATGLTHKIAHGSIRFSIGHDNKDSEIDFVIDKMHEIVAKLRDMSPIWNG